MNILAGVGSVLWSAATHPIATLTGVTTIAAVVQNPGAISSMMDTADKVGQAVAKTAQVSAGVLGVLNGAADSLMSLYNYAAYELPNPIKYAYQLHVQYDGSEVLREGNFTSNLKDALGVCVNNLRMSFDDMDPAEHLELGQEYQRCATAAASGAIQDFAPFGKGWPVKEVLLAIGGAYLTYKLVISPIRAYFAHKEERQVELDNKRAETDKLQAEKAKTLLETEIVGVDLEGKKMELELKKLEFEVKKFDLEQELAERKAKKVELDNQKKNVQSIGTQTDNMERIFVVEGRHLWRRGDKAIPN